jgi:hypothetical protein
MSDTATPTPPRGGLALASLIFGGIFGDIFGGACRVSHHHRCSDGSHHNESCFLPSFVT